MDSELYNEIIERLKKKFMDFDINFEEFNDLLQTHNAFITGSFMLQVIQNEFYPAQSYDIDIFTFGEKNKELEIQLNNIISKSILHKIIKKKINVVEKNRMFKRLTSLEYRQIFSLTGLNELNKYLLSDNKKDKEFKFLNPDKLINSKITTEDSNIEKIDYNHPINLDISLINNWINEHEKYGLTKKDSVNIKIDSGTHSVEIVEKYKSINICNKTITSIHEDYISDKINEIVDFTITNDIMSKYQLVYYDNNTLKTPEDILVGFDLIFCANYWDGKKLFVKDYNSIKTKSCVLNLTKPRIYRNKNKRLIKYIKRNFDIKIKYNQNIYDVLYLHYDKNKLIQSRNLDDNINNLVIICNDCTFSINTVLDNLPINLERLIIYTYNNKNIIDNLPTSVQELRLYLWKEGDGNEVGQSILHKKRDEFLPHQIMEIEKRQKKIINLAIKGLKKIPFGCQVYINDEIIEL